MHRCFVSREKKSSNAREKIIKGWGITRFRLVAPFEPI